MVNYGDHHGQLRVAVGVTVVITMVSNVVITMVIATDLVITTDHTAERAAVSNSAKTGGGH